MLTKKEQARYRAIVRQLSSLSSRGWDRATHADYEPLETELAALATKMVGPPDRMAARAAKVRTDG